MISVLVHVVAICDGRKDHPESTVGADFRAATQEEALASLERSGWFLGSARGDGEGNDLCPACYREARAFIEHARKAQTL